MCERREEEMLLLLIKALLCWRAKTLGMIFKVRHPGLQRYDKRYRGRDKRREASEWFKKLQCGFTCILETSNVQDQACRQGEYRQIAGTE